MQAADVPKLTREASCSLSACGEFKEKTFGVFIQLPTIENPLGRSILKLTSTQIPHSPGSQRSLKASYLQRSRAGTLGASGVPSLARWERRTWLHRRGARSLEEFGFRILTGLLAPESSFVLRSPKSRENPMLEPPPTQILDTPLPC